MFEGFNESIIGYYQAIRKKISFVHEDELSSVFYGRDILNRILAAFDSVQDVYFMLKEALRLKSGDS